MKIAWFTPLHYRSAIGELSVRICEELTRLGCVVELHSEPYDKMVDCKKLKVKKITPDLRPLFCPTAYDAIIYNIGNYTAFHGEIMNYLYLYPGTVILHDATLLHLAYEHSHHRDVSGRMWSSLLGGMYGSKAFTDYSQRKTDAERWAFIQENLSKLHFLDLPAAFSLGVIVHSDYQKKILESASAAPVQVLRLPVYKQIDDLSGDINFETPYFVSMGLVDRQKRIDSVLLALAAFNRDSERPLRYKVVGPSNPEYLQELKSIVQHEGLSDCVEFLGWQPEASVRKLLGGALFAVNLRYPSTEGASAALNELLQSGKCVLATDNAVYKEYPDELVIKMPLEGEVPALKRAFGRFVAQASTNPGFFKEHALRAREYVQLHHSPESYAHRVLECAKADLRRFARAYTFRTLSKNLSMLRSEASNLLMEDFARRAFGGFSASEIYAGRYFGRGMGRQRLGARTTVRFIYFLAQHMFWKAFWNKEKSLVLLHYARSESESLYFKVRRMYRFLALRWSK